MGHEGRPVAVVEEERGLGSKVLVGLAQGREDRVVERPGGADGLGQVEERRGAVLAHPLVSLLRPDPGREPTRDEGDDKVGAEHEAVLQPPMENVKIGGMKR
jgi:hypothetical protein